MASKIPATLIPGDGIGPEITAAVTRILDALGSPFEWDLQQGGMAGIQSAGDPLPGALIDSIRRTKLALKGPLTTPVGGGFRSVNVRLREEFELFANLRPVKTMVPGGRYEDIDLVLIRENIEGLYVAFEHFIRVWAMIRMRLRSPRASTPMRKRDVSCASHSSMRSRMAAR